VAFIQSGEMAVAYFQVHLAGTYNRLHSSSAFLPIVNRGELALVLCFVFLYLAFAGGGAFSVDALLRRRRTFTEPPLRAD
jgi:putative oxidoreductase